jgi:hypothetical protein
MSCLRVKAVNCEDESMIACCGLYCGDCTNHKGEVADLARDLRKKLREAKFDRTAQALAPVFKEFASYDQCYDTLGAMVRMRCPRACRNGGGNPGCPIRKCATEKGIDGCWECGGRESCGKFAFLETVHGNACQKNLRRLAKNGKAAFVEGKRDW